MVALSGCGVTRGDDSRDLLMMIPNSPGGGYDQTGRAAVQVMEDADITGGSFTVDNVIGAGGAAAMTNLVGKAGDEHTMMTAGLGVVGSTYSFGSEYQLQDATPLAQLMSEPEGVLVPGDSPYETLDDLVQAWTDDPGSIAVGGGSSPGGPDHLFPMQLADEIGVDPNDVNYVSYDGGGPLTSALLGEKIDVGFSGLAEFVGQIESGELRVLAVSGEERYPDGTARRHPDPHRGGRRPRLPELARGAGPARDQRGAHRGADRLPRGDARQPGLEGPARGEGLDRRLQDRRRLRRVHRRAGRAGVGDPPGTGAAVSDRDERGTSERPSEPSKTVSDRDERGTSEAATPPPGTVDKSQYLLAAGLFLVGVYTIIDARGLNVGFGDPIGPRVFPYLIGARDGRPGRAAGGDDRAR